MAKVKLISALVLVALVIIVVLQNTQPVEAKFLFLTLTLPCAALVGITMLVGVAVGMLLALVMSGRKKKRK